MSRAIGAIGLVACLMTASVQSEAHERYSETDAAPGYSEVVEAGLRLLAAGIGLFDAIDQGFQAEYVRSSLECSRKQNLGDLVPGLLISQPMIEDINRYQRELRLSICDEGRCKSFYSSYSVRSRSFEKPQRLESYPNLMCLVDLTRKQTIQASILVRGSDDGVHSSRILWTGVVPAQELFLKKRVSLPLGPGDRNIHLDLDPTWQ